MPIIENPDGTLWIDVDEMSEIDAIRTRLTELGGRMTALVPDPTCDVTVEEVEWADLYPKIVPRNGPEPGIIVQPAEIPEGHTLLLATQTMTGAPRGHEIVVVLRLIRGPAPPRFANPRLRAASPPHPAC
jgi:hypothetical protein